MYGDMSRPPRSLLVWDSSSFLHEKNRVTSQVEQLHFNYKVALVACVWSLVWHSRVVVTQLAC